MKRFLLILVPLFFSNSDWAQNLVPNPSFEDTIGCPSGGTIESYCVSWYRPTGGSSDYFNSCDVSWGRGVPSNSFGYQPAHTGSAYAGFGAWIQFDGREYISVKLTDSLIQGSIYCISFYVSLAPSSQLAIKSVGAYLSTDSINFPSQYLTLLYAPQVVNVDSFLHDTINWMLVNGTFIAVGGEKYLTIGNFLDNANTDTLRVLPPPLAIMSYYYIDDVAVFNCDSLIGIDSPVNSSFTLFPNPSSGNFLLSGNFPSNSQLHLFNLLGQEVTDPISLADGNQKIPIALNLAEGIYVYRIISTGEILHEEKLVIVK